jgi:hypothetical protein
MDTVSRVDFRQRGGRLVVLVGFTVAIGIWWWSIDLPGEGWVLKLAHALATDRNAWIEAFVPTALQVAARLVAVWLATACSTELILALRGMRPARLPDPENNPDLPISRPASRAEAHKAMLGSGSVRPPHFRT